ncbi:MAG: acetyl-CoA carboxylase biotin carboxyl carrier protein [Alphaproteobacteria bacterium]
MTDSTIDVGLVRELAQLLDEVNLTEIEYEGGGLRVRVARTVTAVAPVMGAGGWGPGGVAPGEAPAVPDFNAHPGLIKAPMVGIVYLGPEPGAAPFVKVGDTVTEGDTVVLIEAMKTFNPVRAPRSGRVSRIFVSDGMPVEYAEHLLLLE